MQYNIDPHISFITPIVMKHLVRMYNFAPHCGLSRILGFSVSPTQMSETIGLEEELIKRVLRENYEISSENSFKLPVGSTVKVKNIVEGLDKRRSKVLPDEYKITKFDKTNKVKIMNRRTGEEKIVSRFMIN
jgi:hypothetical protein